jgi:hypothetical protein
MATSVVVLMPMVAPLIGGILVQNAPDKPGPRE